MNKGIGIDWEYLKYLPITAPRAHQKLELLSRGYNYPEIAEVLGIAKSTVKNEIQRVRGAAGARTVPHLVALAHDAGIL